MRKIVPLMILLIIGSAMGQITTTSVGVAEPIKAIDSSVRTSYEYSCNSSPEFISLIKQSIISELKLESYSFSNLTNTYCYDSGDYQSINLNFLFKETESSILGKSVGVNIYSSSTTDFSIVFNEDEINRIDYTIKQKYIEYLINGTDSEFYVTLSPNNECNELKNFFEGLNGEKYFNEENGYCSVVIKINVSQVKNLLDKSVNYINYLGDKIKFNFDGYSQGVYDLASIATLSKCDLSKNDYYYPSDIDGCYGIYKDKTRVYFSTSKNSTYISVYGYLGGKAKIQVGSYETIDNDFISESLIKYLGNDYDIKIDETEWGSFEGSLRIDELKINMDVFNDFKKQEYQMNTDYYDDYTYLTISEPYIQIYVPEEDYNEGVSVSSVSSEGAEVAKIMPYYWGRSIVITKSKVYTSITMDENNMDLAIEKIKGFVNNYVQTSDWSLNMRVSGGYYYPIMYAEAGMTKSNIGIQSIDLDSAQTSSISRTGVNDLLASNNENADFSELEDKTIIETVINFLKSLLGL